MHKNILLHLGRLCVTIHTSWYLQSLQQRTTRRYRTKHCTYIIEFVSTSERGQPQFAACRVSSMMNDYHDDDENTHHHRHHPLQDRTTCGVFHHVCPYAVCPDSPIPMLDEYHETTRWRPSSLRKDFRSTLDHPTTNNESLLSGVLFRRTSAVKWLWSHWVVNYMILTQTSLLVIKAEHSMHKSFDIDLRHGCCVKVVHHNMKNQHSHHGHLWLFLLEVTKANGRTQRIELAATTEYDRNQWLMAIHLQRRQHDNDMMILEREDNDYDEPHADRPHDTSIQKTTKHEANTNRRLTCMKNQSAASSNHRLSTLSSDQKAGARSPYRFSLRSTYLSDVDLD